MSQKVKRYPIYDKDIKRLSGECDYLILYSNRDTGKSYASKKFLLKQAYEAGEEFVYLRRGRLDVKDIDTNDYFADMDVSNITKGEYQYVNVFRRRIYFANDEDGKIVNKKKIGYVMDLQGMESRKSLMYPKVGTIVFEEYVTESYYLPHEADSLFPNLISSIFRDRKGFVIMIGNKVSKFNPYVQEWNLAKLPGQKTDTIDDYEFTDEGGKTVKIKSWNIRPREETSGMFFGNSAKNIDGDSYKVQAQNKLDDDINEFNVIYSLVVDVQNIKYLMQFMKHKKSSSRFTWYVTPKTTPIQKGTRLITDKFSSDPLTSHSFSPLTDGERIAFDYIKRGKIAYASNMLGTEFKQALSYLGAPID